MVYLMLLVLLLMPAFGHAQTMQCPNSPGGSTLLTETNWSALDPGWFDAYNGASFMSIVSNQNDPQSPPGALQGRYPNGHIGGNGVGNFYFNHTGRSSTFYCFWWKIDSPFQNHPTGTKILYFTGPNGNGHPYYLLFTGTGSTGPFQLKLVSQGGANLDNTHIGSCAFVGTCVLNGSGSPLTVNTWARIEVLLTLSTSISSQNGIARWWVDGVLNGNHTNVNTDPAYPFGGTAINPVYGGGPEVSKTEEDFMWFGHMLIKDPSAGGPTPPPPTPPPVTPPPPAGSPGTVTNLTATPLSSSSVTLQFTTVANGIGGHAVYDIRFAPNPINWGTAPSVLSGTCTPTYAYAPGTTGASTSCTVTGLTAGTPYQFMLVGYRGTPNVDAVFGGLSNIASATTSGTQSTSMGILEPSVLNARYFANQAGQIVYLQGGYFGCELQDNCFNSTNGASNWTGVISDLTTYNGNLLRMWTSETGGSTNIVSPMPWNRHASTCCAPDGLNKYNLASLNVGNLTTPTINSTAYFERMRARVIDARNRGIYVSIMLFHSFGCENNPVRNPGSTSWTRHPFNSANNTNSVNGDPDADGLGCEDIYSVNGPGAAFQQAYIDQVVDTVQDLDNVLFEVCNECYETTAMNQWQESVIDRIRQRELPRPLQHPVGWTSMHTPSGGVSSLLPMVNSDASYYAPGGGSYQSTPAQNAYAKVSVLDTDHITGCPTVTDNDWAWKAFTRGHNLWLLYCTADHAPSAAEIVQLTRMGQTRTWTSQIDLRTAIPDTAGATCSTTYCLRNTNQVLGFLPGGGSITLSLPTVGVYGVQWFNPTTGTTVTAADTTNGTPTLTAPFGGDAVVFVERVMPAVSAEDCACVDSDDDLELASAKGD